MHLEGAAVATEAFAERLRVSKCFLPLGGCKNHFNICPTTCEEKKVDSFTYLTQVIHERPQLIHIYIVFFPVSFGVCGSFGPLRFPQLMTDICI
jgi:hypothetical protein